VRFTSGDIGRTWDAGANHYDAAFANVSICEYRQLAASDAGTVVQAKFGSGQMTSLVSTFAKAVQFVIVPGGSARHRQLPHQGIMRKAFGVDWAALATE
jgi:hypothetical protein